MPATRFEPRPLPDDLMIVREALQAEYPISIQELEQPRERVNAAFEIVTAATTDIEGVTVERFRGRVGVLGTEIDTVWLACNSAVIDLYLPLNEKSFWSEVAAFVANDMGHLAFEGRAKAYPFDARIIGEFPRGISYVGAPYWTKRAR